MKKNTWLFLLLIPLLQGLFACKCVEAGEEPDVYQSGFSFTILSKQTGQNLLYLGAFYNPSTVKVFDEKQIPVFNGPVSPNGTILFYPIQQNKDGEALSKEVSRKFYVYLNENDTDTIRMDFKLKKIKECGYKRDDIDYIRIYYNDSLYASRNQLAYEAFRK